MPGSQYDTLTVYSSYGEMGYARSASLLVANVALPHRVYQGVTSVLDRILTRVLNTFAPVNKSNGLGLSEFSSQVGHGGA